MIETPAGHSPLGASGASRWMKCPGSVSLSRGHSDEESEHAALGTAAHELAAHCLTEDLDAWMMIGSPTGGHIVDKDMADAVQVYLDYIRNHHVAQAHNSYIEHRFHRPGLHKFFYGTTDFAFIDGNKRELTVVDYKHGIGVVVEAPNNPQLMYYAAGMVDELDLWHAIDTIRVVVVQPRAFHSQGPIREWTLTTEALDDWLTNDLIPAMNTALVSNDTMSGEHCRFCPVRSKACPQLLRDMDELEALVTEVESKSKGAEELTNEQLARFHDLFDVAKIVKKAADATTFNRLQAGATIRGCRLVSAKVNRTWKEDAEPALKEKFGKDAYEPETLKSPAQIEKLAEGEKMTARWAFKPEAGLVLARGEDTRPSVNSETKSLFKPVKKGKK